MLIGVKKTGEFVVKDKNKAFTIVELVVAVALLVMLVGLSSVVFSTTVKAHRKAMATIEITRNLRVLTEQLNADFQGLRKDAPVALLFERDTLTGLRYDQILFFADGDFQTVMQYDTDSDGSADSTVYGNLSRIYYGMANSPVLGDYKEFTTLSRRPHLLTSDTDLINSLIANGEDEFPDIYDGLGNVDYSEFLNSNMTLNDSREFDTITLTDWMNVVNYYDTGLNDYANAAFLLDLCFSNPGRPVVDFSGTIYTYHLLMAQGVFDFKIQFAYFNDSVQEIRWFPDADPDNDAVTNDDHFGGNAMNIPVIANTQSMGIIFNIPIDIAQPTAPTTENWHTFGSDPTYQYCRYWDNVNSTQVTFPADFYPTALKFTFRLKDSNNIFPDGKTFTHIVYLDN